MARLSLAGSRLTAMGLSVLLPALLMTAAVAAETRILAEGEIPTQEPWSLEILSDDPQGIELEFRLECVELEESPGGLLLRVEGLGAEGRPGWPNLPALSEIFAVPPDAGLGLEVLEVEWSTLSDMPPAPVPLPQSDRPGSPPPGPPLADPLVYDAADPWPEEALGLGTAALWHGVRVCPVDLRPFRWHPRSGVLEVCSRMRFRLRFDGTDFGNLRDPLVEGPSPLRSKIVENVVFNADWLREQPWLSGERLVSQELENLGRYLVVVPDIVEEHLDSWADWKRQLGYAVNLVHASELGGDPDWEDIHALAQDLYDEQGLDYLLLVGDVDTSPNNYYLDAPFIPGGSYAEPGWGSRCNSSYCIVTDHPYALMEGDDYFADILVGRWTVDNLNQLLAVRNKHLLYEQDPFTQADSTWFHEGLMIFDVAGAGSRRETKLGIRDMLWEIGFTEVDTIRNNWMDDPVPPHFVSQALNAGVSTVNYRGYGFRYQWVGPTFGVTHINNLDNYGRWPLVASIVCGGGDFASYTSDPCFGEAWLRAAEGAEPLGAIAFIGPSEEDTHTKWNNCIDLGIYQGLCREGIREAAALMERGKLELWLNFPDDRNWGAPGQNVPFYFHTYNLLGDPGLQVRTARPRRIFCEAPAGMPAGLRQLELQVVDAAGSPLPGVTANFYDPLEGKASLGFSDAAGWMLLELGELSPGAHILTLHGVDMRPLQLEMQVEDRESAPGLQDWSFDDGEAGDGLPGCGESGSLDLVLVEHGTHGFQEALQLVLRSLDDRLSIDDSTAVLQPAAGGDTLYVTGDLEISLGEDVSHGERLAAELLLDGEWLGRLELDVSGHLFEATDWRVLSGEFQPDTSASVELELHCNGTYGGADLFGRIISQSPGVTVPHGDLESFSLQPGESAWIGTPTVAFAGELLPGMILPFILEVYGPGDTPGVDLALSTAGFNVSMGTAEAGDPMGPDPAGYLIFHSEDTEYEQAPAWEWNDISQSGTEIVVNDEYDDWWGEGIDGVSRVVQLPFEFSFYGETWDEITVCSNGWIAMGDRRHFITGLNTMIPAAQGPPGMVAAYWTDLYNYEWGNRFGHLYKLEDDEQHRFVLQWDNFCVIGTSYHVDFQLMLLDPAHWPTSTGEGEILCYYLDVASYAGENEFTTGIESYDELQGLCYVFNDEYAESNQPIEDETAIRITALPEELNVGEGEVPGRPAAFRSLAAAPNPFNPATSVRFELGRPARVEWSLYNLLGQEVGRDELGLLPAGAGAFQLDAGRLGSGVYMLRVRAVDLRGGEHGKSCKLLLIR